MMNAEEFEKDMIEGEALSDDALDEVAGGKERSRRYLEEHGFYKTETQHVVTGKNAGLTFRDKHGNRTGYYCGNHVSIWIKPSDKFKKSYDEATGQHDVTFIRAYRNGHEGYVNRHYVVL